MCQSIIIHLNYPIIKIDLFENNIRNACACTFFFVPLQAKYKLGKL